MKLKHRLQHPVRVAVTRFVAALLVVAGSALPALPAAAADEAADTAAQIEIGRKTYTSFCTRCHGIRLASTGLGFDLRSFPRDDKARFARVVANGQRAMPAWGGVLKAEDIDAIWAYMGSVNGWDAAAPATTTT